MLNKSLWTNLISLALIGLGFLNHNQWLYDVGLFAFSGAITNWLAIYMLFEKVPGIYGSGVVPNQFESFKFGLYDLIMNQFFTRDNIHRFMQSDELALDKSSAAINETINDMDFNPLFDALVGAVEQSSLGTVLHLVGGKKFLEGLREPFLERVHIALGDMLANGSAEKIAAKLMPNDEILHDKVALIVKKRIDELTPYLVKKIVQKMIHKHLGWLVVWGGVFGGFIGLIAAIRV